MDRNFDNTEIEFDLDSEVPTLDTDFDQFTDEEFEDVLDQLGIE